MDTTDPHTHSARLYNKKTCYDHYDHYDQASKCAAFSFSLSMTITMTTMTITRK